VKALALIVALSACVPGVQVPVRVLTAAEAAQVDDAMRTWAATEAEPIGDDCHEDRARIRVAIVRTHAEMQSAAGYVCGPSSAPPEPGVRCLVGRANGAYRRARDGGVWPFALFASTWPLIVMWHEAASPRLARHESLHFISECSSGDPDHQHSRGAWTQ